jgi:hypothetical protein
LFIQALAAVGGTACVLCYVDAEIEAAGLS